MIIETVPSNCSHGHQDACLLLAYVQELGTSAVEDFRVNNELLISCSVLIRPIDFFRLEVFTLPSVSQALNSFWNYVLFEQIQMISVDIIYSNKMIAPNDFEEI